MFVFGSYTGSLIRLEKWTVVSSEGIHDMWYPEFGLSEDQGHGNESSDHKTEEMYVHDRAEKCAG